MWKLLYLVLHHVLAGREGSQTHLHVLRWDDLISVRRRVLVAAAEQVLEGATEAAAEAAHAAARRLLRHRHAARRELRRLRGRGGLLVAGRPRLGA